MVTAYVLIQTEVGKAGQVAGAATEINGVQHAYPLTGPYDVIVRAEAGNIDALGADLLAVVDQTMQPTQGWLWLRPPAVPRPR